MYFFYRMLSYGALPFALLRVLYKGIKLPEYRNRISERLGNVSFDKLSDAIWIHAVSVGEAQAAIPLLMALKKRFSHLPCVVTTTTPTGSELIKKNLKQGMYHSYLPYDIPFAVKKFIKHIQPKCLIVMETEIWPNLFSELCKKNIPIVIVNGRLSPSSFRGYLKIKGFISKVLSKCTKILVQNENYAKKFIQLGAERQKVIITGNIKFDIPIPEDKVEAGKKIKKEIFKRKKVWIGASTHEGEEKDLLKIHLSLLKKYEDLKLILVPRHPERFLEVYNLCKSFGFKVHKRSTSLYPKSEDFNIYLGDSMGEMMMYYAMSDVAFVGGSLVEVGGHNLLEPASLALPIVTGPNIFNFEEIAELLKKRNGLLIGKDLKEVEEYIAELLFNEEYRVSIGRAAKEVANKNQGALEKTLSILMPILG